MNLSPHDYIVYTMITALTGAVTKLWVDNRRLYKDFNRLMKCLGINESIVEQVGECSVQGCYLRKHAAESLARRLDEARSRKYRSA